MIPFLLLALLTACQSCSPVAPISGTAMRTRSSSSIAPPPDILLVIMDDVGYQSLIEVRDAGYAPNLWSFAQAGFIFQNVTSSPICSPSRRGVLFGEFYSRQSSATQCGALCGDEPPLSSSSLAQALAGQSYSSAFFGKWHLGSDPAGASWELSVQARGWPHWQAGIFIGVGGCGGNNYSFWNEAYDGTVVGQLAYQPLVMMQRFQALWPNLPSPRFVVYSAQLAHSPYHRPPAGLLPAGYPPTGTDEKKYKAMIAALDVQFGQILATVDLVTTQVWVMGDNGTPGDVSPDPLRSKGTTFQRGVRVPLFAGGAGIAQGSSLALVSTADLYATLVEASGGTPDPNLDSRSLLPLIAGTATKIRDYVATGIQGDTPQFRDDLAARSLQYKYRRTRGDPSQPWVEEFYDLAADPNELTNVVGLYPNKVAQHRAVVDQELP